MKGILAFIVFATDVSDCVKRTDVQKSARFPEDCRIEMNG